MKNEQAAYGVDLSDTWKLQKEIMDRLDKEDVHLSVDSPAFKQFRELGKRKLRVTDDRSNKMKNVRRTCVTFELLQLDNLAVGMTVLACPNDIRKAWYVGKVVKVLKTKVKIETLKTHKIIDLYYTKGCILADTEANKEFYRHWCSKNVLKHKLLENLEDVRAMSLKGVEAFPSILGLAMESSELLNQMELHENAVNMHLEEIKNAVNKKNRI